MNIPTENLRYFNFVHHKSYMTLDWIQAAEVGNQQLTAWAVAYFFCDEQEFTVIITVNILSLWHV
jgi:hypothetical protein